MASQENKTPDPSNEKRKKTLAGVLIAVLAIVFFWQDPLELFKSGAGPATTPTVTAQARTSPTPKGSPTPSRSVKPLDEVVKDPLRPEFAFYKGTPLDGSGRNIFVYPTPTPPPTPKPLPPQPPPTPLPITLIGINPAGVIGRTGELTLALTGMKFPPDARIYLDGREIKTTVIDDSHVTGVVTAEMISKPGNLGVQVRSASDAKLYSNQFSFNVAEPPAPPYRYVGLIVGKQGTTAVLKSQTDDDVINVKKGEKFGKPKRWEVKNISSQRIELFDTDIKVTHFINFTGDSGS